MHELSSRHNNERRNDNGKDCTLWGCVEEVPGSKCRIRNKLHLRRQSQNGGFDGEESLILCLPPFLE
jgi:hypothetical protein